MGQNERTNVFVVGAGASAEFGLPTGRQLLDRIGGFASSHYDPSNHRQSRKIDPDLDTALEVYAFEISAPAGATYALIDSLRDYAIWISRNCVLAPSIDNLLHAHQDNKQLVAVGKIMIAHALVKSESGSVLFPNSASKKNGGFFSNSQRNGEHVLTPVQSWLGQLFWLLVELRDYSSFLTALQNITFISFNYDRCIEHYLANAASSYFRLDEKGVKDVLASINIIRPYGTLGDLLVSGQHCAGFGTHEVSLNATSKSIRTFTEGYESDVISEQLSSALLAADLVFFVGFGFLQLNLNLLFEKQQYKVKRVLGTRKGLSEESASIVSDKLKAALLFGSERPTPFHLNKIGSDRLELSDLTCQELLNKHQFFLRDP